MRMRRFKATHEITFTPASGPPQTYLVRLDDSMTYGGPAYTADEWQADALADWTYDPKDGWRCLGQVTPGGANGTVTVRRFYRCAFEVHVGRCFPGRHNAALRARLRAKQTPEAVRAMARTTALSAQGRASLEACAVILECGDARSA